MKFSVSDADNTMLKFNVYASNLFSPDGMFYSYACVPVHLSIPVFRLSWICRIVIEKAQRRKISRIFLEKKSATGTCCYRRVATHNCI